MSEPIKFRIEDNGTPHVLATIEVDGHEFSTTLLVDSAKKVSEEIDRLSTAASLAAKGAAYGKLVSALKAYEQWEADWIMENKLWTIDNLGGLTEELYDKLVTCQTLRNQALSAITAAASGGKLD